MLAKIIIRNSSKDEWFSSNPLLEKGEMGYENDTSKFKIGNGVDHWNDLPYQLGQWKTSNNLLRHDDFDVLIGKNLQVDGNLFVKGITTTLNSKEVTFNDRIITLNWSKDPVKHYDENLISGIEVNIGWPNTQLNPLYYGGEISSTPVYYPEDDQSVITVGDTLSGWPPSSTYRENYVIYFSPDQVFENPDLAFVIKSYDETTNELTVFGDASGVSPDRDFEIHNVIRQLYWNNNLNHSGWHVDNDFYANNGVVFGDNTGEEVGTIKWTGTDFQGRFDGYWKSLSSSTYVGDTVPNNPSNSDLWWDSSDGSLRIYYTDENSSQWVVIGSGGTSTTTSGGGDYGDTNVELLLNRSNVSDGYILSWTNGDYSWIQPSTGTEGPAGQDGSDGTDGLSAYEIAQNNGYGGTEAEWLSSLVGPAGQDGTNGTNGSDGTDGLSAYEIAQNNGYGGTEAEWLSSLQGADGTNGTNGSDGTDGLSAYEIAQNNGYGGTEAEWLSSLVGPAGQDGTDGATTLNDLTDVNTAGLTNGSILKYDGTSWIIGTDDASGGTSTTSISDTAPTSPSSGDLWWDSDNGSLKIYYSQAWVDASTVESSVGGSSISSITDGTSTLSFDTNNNISIDTHIIPDTNAAYDLGSAEYKIRHLFLSDNSLWIGDDHKIDTSDGTFKTRKRKKDSIPNSVLETYRLSFPDATAEDVGAAAILWINENIIPDPLITLVKEITLQMWIKYLNSLDSTKTNIEDLYPPEYLDGVENNKYKPEDYDEIIHQRQEGKRPALISDPVEGVYKLPLFNTKRIVIIDPPSGLNIDAVGAEPIPGNTVEFTLYIKQGPTPQNIESLNIDGVPANQLRISGVSPTANEVNICTVKAVFIAGSWHSSVVIG